MNPELQKAVAEFLAMLKSGAESAASQIPDLLQQQLAYARVVNTAVLLAGLVLFAICLPLMVRSIKQAIRASLPESYCVSGFRGWTDEQQAAYQKAREKNFAPIVFAVLHGLAAFAALFMITGVWTTVVRVWMAPKVYLLQWIIGLAKSV